MSLFSLRSNFLLELIILIFLLAFSLKLFNIINFLRHDYRVFSYDSLRILLIILRIFIISLLIRGRYTNVNFSKKSVILFMRINFFILLFLVLSFISSKLINFYIFFEASLIPIFLLIIGWGYQPERLQAGIYILFYTLFASLPLILVILIIKNEIEYFYDRFNFDSINYLNNLILAIIILAFLVKLPIFFFHLWLPKAHVEAPVAGSMILAGVLLKLGGYGL
jgi:NADH-ubiquinone oxidoreductase chain 4